MGRTASFTYEDFKGAAEAVITAGRRVCFASVKAELGGGTYAVIKRYLTRYEDEQRDKQKASGEYAGAVLEGTAILLGEAKEQATVQARKELQGERDTLAAERGQFEAERDALHERAAAGERAEQVLSAHAADLAAQLEAERSKRQSTEGALASLREEIARLKTLLEHEQAERSRERAAHGEERERLVRSFGAGVANATERLEAVGRILLKEKDRVAQEVGKLETAHAAERSLAGTVSELAMAISGVDAQLANVVEELRPITAAAVSAGVIPAVLFDARKEMAATLTAMRAVSADARRHLHKASKDSRTTRARGLLKANTK